MSTDITAKPVTYRVIAAEVQVLQWTGENVAEMEAFAGPAFIFNPEQHPMIMTPWGDWANLDPGSYVVRGVTGSFWIIDADTLADNYEISAPDALPPEPDYAWVADMKAPRLASLPELEFFGDEPWYRNGTGRFEPTDEQMEAAGFRRKETKGSRIRRLEWEIARLREATHD